MTRRAECELEQIQDYYEQATGSSERITTSFDRAFAHLLLWPHTGHYRPEFMNVRHRFWRVDSYLVAYLVEDPWLVVTTILHTARDLKKELESIR